MKFLTAGLFPLVATLLASCASVSVTDEHHEGAKPTKKPGKIYVAEFSAANANFKIAGEEGKDPEAYKHKIADLLATYTVKSVNDHVAAAQRTNTTAGLPKSGWLITGEFLRVNTGNRE